MSLLAGTTLIIEHKTASSDVEDGSPYWKRLRLDSQSSNYMVGARALGFEPVGVLYDIIRKPSLRLLKATPVEDRKYTKPTAKEPAARLYKNQRETDETLDEYRARLIADIAENPDHYYKRGVVVRHASEERDAAYDVWSVADQISDAQRLNRWPRNVDACERYGRFCEFFPVCTEESALTDQTRYRRVSHDHEELSSKKRHLPVVTTSGMKTFRRCHREYHFRYELGFRSLDKVDALAFGTLIHAGLEVWWKTVDLGKTFAELARLAGPTGKQANDFHLVNAEELLRGYHARWSDEAFDVLAVEAEFETPLVDPDTGSTSKRWALGGKIDAIARVAA